MEQVMVVKKEDIDMVLQYRTAIQKLDKVLVDRIGEIIFLILDGAGISRDRIEYICSENYDCDASVSNGKWKWTWVDAESAVSFINKNGNIRYNELNISNYDNGRSVRSIIKSSILKTGSQNFLSEFPIDYLFMSDEDIKKDVAQRIANSEKDLEERRAKEREKKKAAEEARLKALAKLTESERKLLGIRLGKKK